MKNFENYAAYYNLLYQDKNYADEVNYIENLFHSRNPNAKTILDLGCGTGRHDYEFYKKGYSVVGVDISDKMLKLTELLPQNDIQFVKSDVRNINLEMKFDVVVSLFHVLSYQQTNEDVINMLSNAYKHLNPGGIFICDFWYAPGVMNDKPTQRIKQLENDKIKIIRFAVPIIHYHENIVDVNYKLFIANKNSSLIEEVDELHRMRYFTQPEIDFFLNQTGFEKTEFYQWMNLEKPKDNTWNCCIISQKKY